MEIWERREGATLWREKTPEGVRWAVTKDIGKVASQPSCCWAATSAIAWFKHYREVDKENA